MKILQKISAVLLAMVMLLSFAACGGNDAEKGKENTGSESNNQETAETTGYVLKGDSNTIALGTPDKTLDPQEVYGKITYTPEMFYGYYRLPGGDAVLETFRENMDFIDFKTSYNEQLSVLPYALSVGPDNMSHMLSNIKEYNWLTASYQTEDSIATLYCAYTVEENTLKLTPVDTFSVNEEDKKITYSLSDSTFEYEFQFKGAELTLSCAGKSVTLSGNLWPTDDVVLFSADAYLSSGSACPDGIDHISFRYDSNKEDQANIYFCSQDGEDIYEAIGVLSDNGLFTFTIPWEAGTKTYQFVYFYGNSDGIVLTDGTNTYYFNDSFRDRNMAQVSDYLVEEQAGQLDSLTEGQIAQIVEKKDDLMADLAAAFEQAGIKVTVDEKTGEMAMDSSILFGGDSAELTDEGKAFLDTFVVTYTSVINNEKYAGFVSKTMVEGHVAPVAGNTYEDGYPLSLERAENVMNYCISSPDGISADMLESVGYSNSKPVTDENGNVDMNASRRVSFRFIINLDSQ